MVWRLLRLCGVCALGLLLVSTTQANLIVNGSFEDLLLDDGGTQQFTTGETIGSNGWKVVGPNVVLIQKTYQESLYGINSFSANDGLNSLDLTGAGTDSGSSQGNSGFDCGIEQTVSTVTGQLYDLSFFVGRADSDTDHPLYASPASVDLSINNGERLRFTTSGSSPGTVAWEQFSHSFLADGSLTVITFFNGTALGTAYAGLDNVSMVPEPASVALLGIGGLALVYVARRRRSSR